MDHVTFHAFVDEFLRLEKTAKGTDLALHFIDDLAHESPALGHTVARVAAPAEGFVSRHLMPIAGGFTGGAGGAALGGTEAYLHNLNAAPEDRKSVVGRAAIGAGIGAGLGTTAGHLGSLGLDKGKAYAQGALHDLGEATTRGATRGMTGQLAEDVPNLVGETVRRGVHEVGAAPAEAARGFLGRLVSPRG